MRVFLNAYLMTVALGVMGCAPTIHAVEVGDRLLLGTITTLDGRVMDQAYWNQRNTLIQVWATWC